ncbi:Acetyltransferase, GNAT family [Desulfamplus magnetovallimortis]|uniref:Acetyltransferase, GNAT family n=1 Tax=Desulfamplus magnetovallimortis TaxID=1246637 RepID=A0A1W1HG74_9BACT|nr:bifunctional acetyl-CoA hydrolase/transferase family protein/GNAT family N-acetyltransferase [Desulfamplus magnetovallimortis]SLM31487.1 Acetyltransferase, GNAT family [Desulfamplus magnetovallimortis]
MGLSSYWADDYVKKQRSVENAVKAIKSGHRVFIGSYCGEPQSLVSGLAKASESLNDIEIIRLMSRETTPLTRIADRTLDQSLTIRSIYLGAARSKALAGNKRFYTPVNMAEVPRLFSNRRIHLDVAMIQVSPPDDFGWMSLGVSVDVTLAAALAADFVIAQVNERMPMVLGQSFIHVNDVDIIVEKNEELMTIQLDPPSQKASRIGEHIVRLIEDGSTLQIGLDAASQATSQALSNKNDLGIHSQFLTQDMMHLYSKGVINNRKKGFNDGKMVAGCSVGTEALYEFLHINPAVEFHSFDYVNDIDIISRHNKMISMNVAQQVDLFGQISCDAQESTLFAGVSGISDFVRGANRSKGGKSIIMLNSTIEVEDDHEGGKEIDGEDIDGKDEKKQKQSDNPNKKTKKRVSALVPCLNGLVTIPREDVRYVVTEFGAVNLFGKSTQERTFALISIAHPEFRDELLEQAKDMGMIGKDRTLGESVYGIYPVKLEEIIDINGETITFRPAKPVDERRIQEHFYHMDKQDIISRFFHEKTRFIRNDVEVMSQIDYKRNLTIIALIGEVGFDSVIGVGSYYLEPATNMAEVAFSISKDHQSKGLGRILLRKLAEAARDRGINGLFAVTSSGNKKMMKLFKTLPYKIHSEIDEDMLLSCRFNQPA